MRSGRRVRSGWSIAGVNHADVKSYRCCMQYVLSQEPDFLAQKPWLQEEVEKVGFNIVYYPKYHCELNPIELVWAWIKAYHRSTCTYKFDDLKAPDGLRKTLEERLPLAFVRRAWHKCERFMHGYMQMTANNEPNPITGALLDFIVKKYTSHRRLPASMSRVECQREMVEKEEKKRKRKHR